MLGLGLTGQVVRPINIDGYRQARIRQRLAVELGQFLARMHQAGIRHNDLHPGNLLWSDAGPAFVDFDDCCAGPLIQDLWMLLPGDEEGRQRALAALIEGYEVFRSFDWAQVALIEPLRALRLIHYGGWLSARYDDPAFPRAFPFAAQGRFWEEHLITLEQQVERL